MNFTVTQEENIVIVTVSLPKLQRDRETRLDINRTVLRENNVRDYLRKSKIAVGKCIKVDNLDNMGDRLSAIWKFESPQEKRVDKPPKTVVSSNRTKKRTRKRSKSKDE